MALILDDDDDLRQLMQDGGDDVINEWGKDCLLLYPPRRVDCGNCHFDAFQNRSANRYQSGGPIPFEDGTICPYCEGQGWRETEVTTALKLRIYWQPSQFAQKFPPTVQLPAGLIQTKGYLRDLPAVYQSRRLIVQTSITPLLRLTYTLWGEPGDMHDIVQGRYFVVHWSRAGG